MKKILFLLIIVPCLYSCLNMNDPKSQAEYIESYRSFDKEMVNHFPYKLPNNYIAASFSSPKYLNEYHNYADFYIKIKISSKEKFKKLKKQFVKGSKIIKKSTDSCLLFVTSKEKQKIYNCNELFPIPEYILSENENKRNKVDKLEIALIDFKSGVFLSKKELREKDTLPEKWKNGYSKGYTFNDNEQTITYWLIIW